MKKLTIQALTLVFAMPVFADGHASGDAEAGEKAFRKCKACHAVVADDGTVVMKGGKTGPNLYGIAGRTLGTAPDFKKYKPSLVAAGEAGTVWDEEQFLEYVKDPAAYLKAVLDDSDAKSGMSFRLKNPKDAANIWAYLVGAAE